MRSTRENESSRIPNAVRAEIERIEGQPVVELAVVAVDALDGQIFGNRAAGWRSFVAGHHEFPQLAMGGDPPTQHDEEGGQGHGDAQRGDG